MIKTQWLVTEDLTRHSTLMKNYPKVYKGIANVKKFLKTSEWLGIIYSLFFFKPVLQTSVPYNVASDCHRSAIWRTVKKQFVLVLRVIVSLKTYKLIKSNFQILMAYKCDDVTLYDFKGQCTLEENGRKFLSLYPFQSLDFCNC